MAKDRSDRVQVMSDRVEDLAAQIYLSLVTTRTGTTPQGSARDALDRAETFWLEADARRARRTEKSGLST